MQVEHKDSYKQIVKATSIFGGVQVIQILISIIRSKFVAVLLGPLGMGINGLLSSTIGLIAGITNFGLGTSAVKSIAHAFGTGDEQKIATIIAVLRKLVWFTGFLGFIITLCLSSVLSKLTFGNYEYTWAFVWLSITLLINQISIGQAVVLRGTRRIKHMAKSTIIGSFLGLFTSLPLYYFYGNDGIVPALIITSITTLLLTWYFSSKVELPIVNVSFNTAIHQGKEMMKLGFVLSISSLITLATSYLLRTYIGSIGGLSQVGLYTAGFAIINTYVGMIFTAMSTDYYPRLAAIADYKEKRTELINQQGEVALLILGPILCLFIIFISLIIYILYSSKFFEISEMIQWAALGVFFKAASWPIGFIFLAKGDTKVFLASEIATNIYMLILNIVFYKFWGMNGLGLSYFISYILLFIQVYIIAYKKYEYKMNSMFIKILFFYFLTGIVCFLISSYFIINVVYVLGTIISLLISLVSLYILNNKLDIIKIKK